MNEKFKQWLTDDTVFLTILLLIVGMGSFFLGRQSVISAPIIPQDNRVHLISGSVPPVPLTATSSLKSPAAMGDISATATMPYVASKAGTKYHLLNCPGVQQIKDKNKIYFATAAAATAAGYTPASNCPGL